MDSYDNDWLFLDDDLFFVCIFVDKKEEHPDNGIDIQRPENVETV